MQRPVERHAGEAARHRGPPLPALAIVYALLVVASVAIPTAMAGGQHFPSPFDPAASRWFVEHSAAALVAGFLLFSSAVPLAIFTATAVSRLQFLGMKVAGIHIALVGGLAAAVALMTSGFAVWTLAGAPESGALHAIHLFSFAAGGPGFVVPFGLLVAGVSLVAGLQGFAPRWLMYAGLVIAALGELSVFAFVWSGAMFLLPIVRFSGLLWMLAAGVLLPTARVSRWRSAPMEQSAGATA